MQPTPIQIGMYEPPIRSQTATSKHREKGGLKEQLKDRLYDKGVSTGKMPAIPRPNSEHMRPYTAKLTSKLTRKHGEAIESLQARMALPIGGYQEFNPDIMSPEDEFIPGLLPEGQGPKSLYGLSKDPMSARDGPGKIINRQSGAASVFKSITGVTVFFMIMNKNRLLDV